MANEHVYHDLPYPLPYVPAPGEPVTTAAISEVVVPLLKTVQCVMETFGNAAELDHLTNEHLGVTLSVLAGHLDLAITLLERLGEADGSDTPATS